MTTARIPHLRKFAAAAALCGLALLIPAAAQSPGPLSAGPAYTSADGHDGPQFPAIDVRVRLVGSDGAPRPFQPSEMRLFSAGAQIARGNSLRTFADAGYGVRAILALDASGSMKGAPLTAIHASIANFVNQARPQDQVEVLTFADDTRVEVPFGSDKTMLAERLRQVSSRGTRTRLYDGLLEALAQLESAPPKFRQLTVISDGHDEGSQRSLDDVINQALADRISIDSIGLTRSSPAYLQTLARMSQATGGSYSLARSAEDLNGLIGQGIQLMRATPVVHFDTTNLDGDGKTHPLEVRWSGGNTAQVAGVVTPVIAKPKKAANPWRVWEWVVAACFVAGAILLFIARRPRRRSQPARPLVPPPPPAEPPREPTAEIPIPAEYNLGRGHAWVEFEEPAPPPERMPTVIDQMPEEPPIPPPRRAQTVLSSGFGAAESSQGARLEGLAGPLAGASYWIDADFSVGAMEGNRLVVPDDATISGYHARLRMADGTLTIEDSNSTNGTWVNGVRLGPGRKLLNPGDTIRMGRSEFRVRRG